MTNQEHQIHQEVERYQFKDVPKSVALEIFKHGMEFAKSANQQLNPYMNLIEQLREANPYSKAHSAYSSLAWRQACDKLAELLQQQQYAERCRQQEPWKAFNESRQRGDWKEGFRQAYIKTFSDAPTTANALENLINYIEQNIIPVSDGWVRVEDGQLPEIEKPFVAVADDGAWYLSDEMIPRKKFTHYKILTPPTKY